MNELLERDLTKIEDLLRKATKAPWFLGKGDSAYAIWDLDGNSVGYVGTARSEYGKCWRNDADRDLIILMRNALPALISAARERERYREALEWYANPEIYEPHPHGPAFDDRDLSFKAKSVLDTPKELHPPASGMETHKD